MQQIQIKSLLAVESGMRGIKGQGIDAVQNILYGPSHIPVGVESLSIMRKSGVSHIVPTADPRQTPHAKLRDSARPFR